MGQLRPLNGARQRGTGHLVDHGAWCMVHMVCPSSPLKWCDHSMDADGCNELSNGLLNYPPCLASQCGLLVESSICPKYQLSVSICAEGKDKVVCCVLLLDTDHIERRQLPRARVEGSPFHPSDQLWTLSFDTKHESMRHTLHD